MSSVLSARGVSVQRGGCEVVHGVDLELQAGDGLALVGPNAAGKSTLLRALVGLLPLASGHVEVLGRPLPTLAPDAIARSVALVTADEGGALHLSVRERAALGRYPHRGPLRPLTDADQCAVERGLRLAGIEALAGRRLGTLSAGERQLAALARGLAQEPRVLLLDEPAAHLDVGHQLALFRVLDEVRASGVAVLAVIHDLQRAASWAPRMALLRGGRIAALGAPTEVLLSEACGLAFGVSVQAHAAPGGALFSFAPRPSAG